MNAPLICPNTAWAVVAALAPVFRIRFRIRIRIRFVTWIRIRIPNADPDPAADKINFKSQKKSYHLELFDKIFFFFFYLTTLNFRVQIKKSLL